MLGEQFLMGKCFSLFHFFHISLFVLVTPATSVLSSLLVIFLLKEMLGNSTWSLFLIFSIHLVNVLAQLNNSNENNNFHCVNTLRFICNTFTNSKPQFSSPQERKSSCDQVFVQLCKGHFIQIAELSRHQIIDLHL